MSTKKEKCCGCPEEQDICRGECMCHHSQSESIEWGGLVTETAERLVIEYANLSGRETANRAEFRKRAATIIAQVLDKHGKKEYSKGYEEGRKNKASI